MKSTLTQSRLKELLSYDAVSGVFTWLKAVNSRSNIGDIAGSKCENGYILIGIDGYGYSAHRLAFLYVEGHMPLLVDHKNCDKSCNSWNNLRVATQYQNRLNSATMSNNSLGIKGVCWVESRKRFKACITINESKSRVRKYFKELEDAVQWLSEMRLIHHKGFDNNG